MPALPVTVTLIVDADALAQARAKLDDTTLAARLQGAIDREVEIICLGKSEQKIVVWKDDRGMLLCDWGFVCGAARVMQPLLEGRSVQRHTRTLPDGRSRTLANTREVASFLLRRRVRADDAQATARDLLAAEAHAIPL